MRLHGRFGAFHGLDRFAGFGHGRHNLRLTMFVRSICRLALRRNTNGFTIFGRANFTGIEWR